MGTNIQLSEEEDANILRLWEIEELTYAQIAKETGRALATIQRAIRRARMRKYGGTFVSNRHGIFLTGPERAAKAYRLRRGGMTPAEVAEKTGYPNVHMVQMAIQRHRRDTGAPTAVPPVRRGGTLKVQRGSRSKPRIVIHHRLLGKLGWVWGIKIDWIVSRGSVMLALHNVSRERQFFMDTADSSGVITVITSSRHQTCLTVIGAVKSMGWSIGDEVEWRIGRDDCLIISRS
ncbi:MAG: sigma-70 region 4 domain-containing protein [Candidatus Uhrbacteria bacterium]|nr:sigma-70 region 4 domain-containing protein [Candidatus Uhrbacteria bacterium]